jgi:flotillin
MGFIVVGVLVLLVAAIAAVLAVRNLLYICQPSEALIISGSHRMLDRREVGYRVVQGGRALRIPLLETVHRLDLTNNIIDLQVKGAYSKGGIPLNVHAVANVKISGDATVMANAIERFLGKPREAFVRLAKETLEGNLRGVLATLTPEEVNQDRVKFALNLQREADSDLRVIGIVLDTLKIQNVSDDRGFMDALGRRQSAEVVMRSRIAEAENKALAAERDARNLEEKELARVTADIEIAKANAERRILEAVARQDALVAEARAEVAALLARSEGEMDVQRARAEQVRLQLAADKIRPAEARRDALVSKARANAAPTVENGKATARAIGDVSQAWKGAGPEAGRMLLAQHLDWLVAAVIGGATHQAPSKVTLVDPAFADGTGGFGIKAGLAAGLLAATGGNLNAIARAGGHDVKHPAAE